MLFNQTDAKRWVAMYSLSHVQLWYTLWFGSYGVHKVTYNYGALFNAMYIHSLTAGIMFLCIGSFVDVYYIRLISELNYARTMAGYR